MKTKITAQYADIEIVDHKDKTEIIINGHYLKNNIDITFINAGIPGVIGPNITLGVMEILGPVHENALKEANAGM
jgi:hypothetical protein